MQQCTWSASGDTWYIVINKDWVSFKLTVKYFILKTSLRDVPGHACPVIKTAFQCKGCWGFPGDSGCKESSYKAEYIDVGSIPGSGRSLGEGNATHSSILAWRIPWTEEPSGLQSTVSQRVGQDWGLMLSGDEDWIPGWGTKIPHASWPKNQNIKQKQYCSQRVLDLSSLRPAAKFPLSVLHMVMYMFQGYSPNSLHPLLPPAPLCPHVCSLHLADSCWYMAETNTIL